MFTTILNFFFFRRRQAVGETIPTYGEVYSQPAYTGVVKTNCAYSGQVTAEPAYSGVVRAGAE